MRSWPLTALRLESPIRYQNSGNSEPRVSPLTGSAAQSTGASGTGQRTGRM